MLPPVQLSNHQPFRGIGRGLLILLLLGTVTFAALGFVGDFEQIRDLIRDFSLTTLLVVLLLSAVNYWLRFVRWQMYLRQLDVRLRWSRSLAIFLTGFLLAVTPGKAGELAKAWLAREFGGGRARPVIAVVVTERLLDVLAVLLLLLSSVFVFTGQRSFVAPIILVAAGAVVAVAYGPVTRRLLPVLAKSRLAALGARPGLGVRLRGLQRRGRRLDDPRRPARRGGVARPAAGAPGCGSRRRVGLDRHRPRRHLLVRGRGGRAGHALGAVATAAALTGFYCAGPGR